MTATNPMPRDSLGRIVYVGDVLTGGAAIIKILPDDEAKIAFPTGGVGFIPFRFGIIDLAASPEHTSYERYFADLGTRDEVVVAADSCLGDDSSTCDRCPLEGWGKAFGFHPAGCAYFNRWLDERAVI